MDSAVVDGRLRAVFADTFSCDPVDLSAGSSPADVPNWTSLKQFELILAIEREFAIRVPDERVVDLTSFGRITDFVTSALAANA
jgi:acyl carrier protein